MKKAVFVITVMVLMLSATSKSFCETHQFGGRIAPDSPTDFKSGINKIWFRSEGTKVVGNLCLPENYKTDIPLPAILVIDPKGAVKEQTKVYTLKNCQRMDL